MKHATKRITAALLTLCMLLSLVVPTAFATDYNDTENHWAKAEIARWSDYGILKGSDGAFRPDAPMTRGEMAVMLDRLMGYKKAAKNDFSDLDNSWYTDAMLKANAAGIILGSNGTVRPSDRITRQEAAVIFARVFGLTTPKTAELTFADSAEVAPWAVGAVSAMASRGYMSGVGGNRFAPNADISRASVVKLLDNAIRQLYAEGGNHAENVTGLAVITKPGTTLKDMTINGDLIIAEGVGDGTVTLDHVTVTGTTTVRGGGDHSLELLGGTVLGKLVLAKYDDVKLSVVAGKDTQITDMVAQSGVLLFKGDFKALAVSGTATVEVGKGASIASIVLSAPGVTLTVNGSAAQVTAEAGATGAAIGGSGKVTALLANANDVKVTTSGTKVTAGAGVTGVTQNGTAVKPGNSTNPPSSGGSDDSDSGNTTISVSPDKDKIIASLTKLPTMKDIPYDTAVTYHSAAAETKSHPFSSMYCSVGAVNLENYGYTEKEYFMSGTANVYGLSPMGATGVNVPVITSADETYTTRLLLRYPTDPNKFTGKVYIDIINASSGVDLEDVWRRSYDHIMKEGHAYIGITSKSLTATALKKFDPVRYADLDWDINAYPDEDGLVWDMLGQLGTWTHSAEAQALFGTKPVTGVYLSGQSQSGFYMNTFLNVFYPYLNNALGGKDIFNGYMNLVGSSNTKLANGDGKNPQRGVSVKGSWTKTEEPYIVMMSGMESGMRSYQQVPDQNSADYKFRLYEVAGAPHSDPTAPIIPNDKEIARAKANGEGRGNKDYNAAHYETDLNLDPFVDAMLDNIDAWAAKGTPAPNADQHWVEKGKLDADGNQLGGIRSPLITAPIATYYPARNNSGFQTDGSMVYFTRGRAVELYGNKETYVAKVKAQADKLLADKYITASGKTWFYNYADSALLFGGPDNATISASIAKVPTVVEKPYGAEVTAHTKSLATKDKDSGIYTTEAKFSHPYASMLCSNGGVDVASFGYTEKEFFLSSTANVYALGEYGNDVPTVKTADQPYTNRVLVRMPSDMEKFSGRVYIDIANASNKSDMEDTWRRSWKFFMENNHGYILITSKDVNVQALKNFDKDRYADINWMVGGHYENGLFWDMLSQLGTALKTPATKAQLLGCAEDRAIHTYLGGQSQSGFYINTYVSVFQQYLEQANGGKPLFDGYYNLVGQSGTSISGRTKGLAGDNSEPVSGGRPKSTFKPLGVPFVALMSEAEVSYKIGKSAAMYKERPDANTKYDMFRLYEVAGAPHSDGLSPIIQNNPEIVQAGAAARTTPEFPEVDKRRSTVQSDIFVGALMDNLALWAENGTTAPKADDKRVATTKNKDGSITINRDENGNALGGLRHPLMDCPTATHASNGSMVMFSDGKLKTLYTDLNDYIAKVTAKVNAGMAAKLIAPSDGKNYIADLQNTTIFGGRDDAKVRASFAKPVTVVAGSETSTLDDHMFNSSKWSVGIKDAGGNDLEPRRDDALVLAEHGYTENEYFISGTANNYAIFQYTDTPYVKDANVTYTNRIIVRKPINMAEFSGRVYIDILNASDKYDSEALWRRANDYIINNHHVYIGMTSQDSTVKGLKNFNPTRYAKLDWAIEDSKPDEMCNDLIWDMLGQLGTYIKSDAAKTQLFGGKEVQYTYLCGQSQSGFYMNTVNNVFGPYCILQDGSKLFDGFVNTVGIVSTRAVNGNAPRSFPIDRGIPYIIIPSQADFSAARRVTVEQNPNLRMYEMAGSPHSVNVSPVWPIAKDLIATKAPKNTDRHNQTDPGDYISTLFVKAQLENIHTWASTGKAPVDSRFIEVDKTGAIQVDECGNTKGGIRSPQLDVPAQKYTVAGIGGGSSDLLDAAVLKTLYPSGKPEYVTKFMAAVDAMIANGQILAADRPFLVTYAGNIGDKIDAAIAALANP